MAIEALSGLTNISGDLINNNLQTAMFMLKIGDKLTSTIDGFTDFAVVQKWSFAMEHYIQGYVSDQVQPRRPTSATPLEVYLLHGDYIPKLLTMVVNQEPISDDSTSLVVLGSSGDVNQELMRIKLTSAVVESVGLSTEFFPFFRVLIRYKTVAVTCNSYKQDDLSNAGTNAFGFDFSINKTTS
jgi:hypothetical protein